MVVKRKSPFTTFCSSSVNSMVRADFPSSRTGLIFCRTLNSSTESLSFCVRAIFSTRAYRLLTDSKSAKINSKLIVSISASGSTKASSRPCSRMTFSSSKARTTWTIASTSRMLAKNLLPRPSPLEAPFTIPAISVNSKVVGTVFLGVIISVNFCSRSSGTSTIPTFGSMVAKG